VESIAKQSVSHIATQDDRLYKINLSLIWVVTARLSKNEFIHNRNAIFIHKLVMSFKKTADCINKYITYAPRPVTLLDIQQSADHNDEQTFVKYHIDAYLCKCFGDSILPKEPNFLIRPLFYGIVKDYVNKWLVKRDLNFFYSLQKGTKKIWPALGPWKLLKACETHALDLSSTRSAMDQDLLDEIGVVTLLLYSNIRTDECQKLIPSGSSCIQATRKQGGNLSLFPQLDLDSVDSQSHTENLSAIGVLRYTNNLVADWRQDTLDQSLIKLKESLDLYRTDVELDPYVPWQKNVVVALPEPGKFRLISKGDGYLYTPLQPLQSALLGRWKSSRYSTMLDQNLSETLSSLLVGYDNFHWGEELVWNSGDFEKSTDKQKKESTFAVLRSLQKCNAPLLDLANLSFQPTLMEYPSYTCEDGSSFRLLDDIIAKEGQLMGHPLSFPILCTVNLSVYRLAVKRWGQVSGKGRYFMAQFLLDKVIINGDDILFFGPRSLLPFFDEIAISVGFIKSVGKNYVSSDMLMINSQVFRVFGSRVVRYGYLNLNLIYGNNIKKSSVDKETKITGVNLGGELSKMFLLCKWTQSCLPFALQHITKDDSFRVIRKFVHTKSGAVIRVDKPFIPNWFLPIHLGGFGVDPSLSPGPVVLTADQRRVATYFIINPKESLYLSSGIKIPTWLAPNSVLRVVLLSEEESMAPKRQGFSELVPLANLEDSWLQRLSYIARITGNFDEGKRPRANRKIGADHPKFSDVIYDSETIFSFSKPLFYAVPTIPCPPLPYLRLPKTDFLSNRFWKAFDSSEFLPRGRIAPLKRLRDSQHEIESLEDENWISAYRLVQQFKSGNPNRLTLSEVAPYAKKYLKMSFVKLLPPVVNKN